MEKIGILGGSFDPIHYGHLILAESAREGIKLDKVLFIPTGNHPFKTDGQIDAVDRYNMTELAIRGNEYFDLSDLEVYRSGTSYTIDTINKLRESNSNVDYYFITGADIILKIDQWKKSSELLKTVKIATAYRPGFDDDKLDKRVDDIRENFGAYIIKVITPEIEISSSDIRQRVKNGKSIKYMVPEKVEQYIYDNNLYT